jgi:hypothetical protein
MGIHRRDSARQWNFPLACGADTWRAGACVRARGRLNQRRCMHRPEASPCSTLTQHTQHECARSRSAASRSRCGSPRRDRHRMRTRHRSNCPAASLPPFKSQIALQALRAAHSCGRSAPTHDNHTSRIRTCCCSIQPRTHFARRLMWHPETHRNRRIAPAWLWNHARVSPRETRGGVSRARQWSKANARVESATHWRAASAPRPHPWSGPASHDDAGSRTVVCRRARPPRHATSMAARITPND